MPQVTREEEVHATVEAVSKEGAMGAPAGNCWIKLRDRDEEFLANVALGLEVGQEIKAKSFHGRYGYVLEQAEIIGKHPPTLPESPLANMQEIASIPSEMTTGSLTVANPASILSPPFSIRTDVGGLDDADLAYSVKTHGLLQPVLVRKNERGELERVAGGRRIRAARSAKLTGIPIILTKMSDADAFLAQLVENLHRKDLTDEEKGRAFKHVLEVFPERFPNQETLAKALGKRDSAWVSHHIDVPEMVDELREQGVAPAQLEGLTSRQVEKLKQLKPEKRKELLEQSEELLSSREIEAEAEKPSKAAAAARTGRPREPATPTGQFFHCKECDAALMVIHKSKTKHLLRPVREVQR